MTWVLLQERDNEVGRYSGTQARGNPGAFEKRLGMKSNVNASEVQDGRACTLH